MKHPGFEVFTPRVRPLQQALSPRSGAKVQISALLDALDTMTHGLCLFDDCNRLIHANARFRTIFQLDPGLPRVGASASEVLRISRGYGSHPPIDCEQLMPPAEQRPGDPDRNPHILRTNDDRIIAVYRNRLWDGGWIAVYEDITERHRWEARIAHLAAHDSLTGLLNRSAFLDALGAALQRGIPFALMLIDVDKFKSINDQHGHAAGDAMLRRTAAALQSAGRPGDVVCRLGGDEFAAILFGREPVRIAEALIQRLAQPIDVGGAPMSAGLSIGITRAPDHGRSAHSLMRSADLALYQAKQNGRGRWCLYDPEMSAQLQKRKSLVEELRRAEHLHQFIVYYQPLYGLDAAEIVAFEALLRWQHPERGMVAPMEFIPLAEEAGLIGEIGRFVLYSACIEATRWAGGRRVAVNVSPLQLREGDFVDVVRDALDLSGLEPSRLELEITESTMLEDKGQALRTMSLLKDQGVRFALDDFGTGYSSLGTLRQFPFDKIKMDRMFMQHVPQSGGDTQMARMILTLGRDVGMSVTAEGVETETQLRWLQNEGCAEAQGFLVGRPGPAETIPALIAQTKWRLASGAGESQPGELQLPSSSPAAPGALPPSRPASVARRSVRKA